MEGPPSQQANEAETFEKSFDPRAYLEAYYPPLDIEKSLKVLERIKGNKSRIIDIAAIQAESGVSPEVAENLCILEWYRKITAELLEAFPEDHVKVLDVGSGPTIYQKIPFGFVSQQMVSLELVEANRKEARGAVFKSKWRKGDDYAPYALEAMKGTYDWSSYFRVMQKMYQRDEKIHGMIQGLAKENPHPADRMEQLASWVDGPEEIFQRKITPPAGFNVSGDIFKENLGAGGERNMEGFYDFDIASIDKTGMLEIVNACFIAESATADREKWKQGMKNIMARVKPGGFISLAAIRNAEWYRVGEEKMPALPIEEADIKEVLEENGFELVEKQVVTGSDQERDGYDGMVFVLAKKRPERKPENH